MRHRFKHRWRRASRRGGQLLTRARSSSYTSACPHLRAPGASVPDARSIHPDPGIRAEHRHRDLHPFVQQRSLNGDAQREIVLSITVLISMQYGTEKVGFQPHPLRHLPLRSVSPDPAAAGFFRYIQRLCGRGCSPAPVPSCSEAFSLGQYSPDLLTARIPVKSSNPLLLQKQFTGLVGRGSRIHAAREWNTNRTQRSALGRRHCCETLAFGTQAST